MRVSVLLSNGTYFYVLVKVLVKVFRLITNSR